MSLERSSDKHAESLEHDEPPQASRPAGSHPFWQLFLSRMRDFLRKPAAVFWVYFFPLLMVISLGIAFRRKPIDYFAVDLPPAMQDTQFAEALAADPRFAVSYLQAAASYQRLRAGKIDLMILPADTLWPADTHWPAVAGAPARQGKVAASGARGADENATAALDFRFLLDPTRPNAVLARTVADDLMQRAAGRQDVLRTVDWEMDEPGGRYIDFLVPGMLGMGLMGGGLWGVGYAIVDMRIRKLLKLLAATPMKRTHFLAAVMSSRIVFALPQIILLLVFTRLAFGVVVHGSYALLSVLILLGALQFSGIGLLVACRAETMETVSGLMNLVMLPMWILSGIFFSTDRFPDFVQPLVRLLPLTPLIDSLRRVMLEGAGWSSVGWELAAMGAWSVATFGLALVMFRWK